MSKICVFTPQIGAPSETFIRRHCNDLEEGGSAVLALRNSPNPAWKCYGPSFCLREPLPMVEPIWLKVAWRLKLPVTHARPDDWSRIYPFLVNNSIHTLLFQYFDQFLHFVGPAKKAGFSVIAHGHGYDMSRILLDESVKSKYQIYNDFSIPVITPCQYGANKLLDSGINQDLIHVIPYGVDTIDRHQFKKQSDKVRVLAVGRMVGKKAPLLLLEAFRLAAQKNKKLFLDYIGSGEHMIPAIDFVNIVGLQDRVTFHGSKPSQFVKQAMKDSDIFLQHSRRDPQTGDEEGLPVAILEAMALGLPVVSTRHAGITEEITHGETGLLVEEGDHVGMARALLELSKSVQRRKNMGKEANARAVSHFSWALERQRLLKLMADSG